MDHDIYIKLFSDGTMCYIAVCTNDDLSTTNNETSFTELKIVFEEHFDMKSQGRSVLKYLHLLIFYSPLDLSVYHTDHIMELLNEWFPTGKFRKVDTHFIKDSTYEK